jgi:hypothetical protein
MANAAGIGSGVLAWMYTSTAKMGNANSRTLSQRFEDAAANALGTQVITTLDPNYVANGGQGSLTPKLMGWANKTTASGILLLAADYFADMAIPQYKRLDGLHEIAQAVGYGVTIGGIVGGILDPQIAAGYTQIRKVTGQGPINASPVVTGNIPFPIASAGRSASVVV